MELISWETSAEMSGEDADDDKGEDDELLLLRCRRRLLRVGNDVTCIKCLASVKYISFTPFIWQSTSTGVDSTSYILHPHSLHPLHFTSTLLSPFTFYIYTLSSTPHVEATSNTSPRGDDLHYHHLR